MIEKFKIYIAQQQLFTGKDKILLTISGGMDSIAMAHLFYVSKFDFAIAHCNFQLRGKDANKDQEFVEKLAKQYKVEFFTTNFNTKEYAEEKGISIQMAARELRYNWFEEIRIKHNFNYIATAHHSDDVIETILINLSRGTGIKGLTGIKAKNNKIIRPLLFASRADIENYVIENKLSYRTDKSNDEIYYSRNFIRKQIIPELEKFYPAIKSNILKTSTYLKQADEILKKEVEKVKTQISKVENNLYKIDISELSKIENLDFYFYEILNDFGFNSSTCDDILNSLHSHSGKVFHSKEYRLLKDRECLIISKDANQFASNSFINHNTKSIDSPIKLSVEHINNQTIKISKDANSAFLDADKVEFPLQIRKWQDGDYFFPLGMTGKKKISDFFIDKKLSIFEKENTWLLCSDNKIVWVINHRIDNRFKITSETKKVLKIEYLAD